MMLRKISLRQAYQITTSYVVKGLGWQSIHYVTHSLAAIFQLFFTTSGVHLLYLAIGSSNFLSWPKDYPLLRDVQYADKERSHWLGDA
jgi:hypothetical protein